MTKYLSLLFFISTALSFFTDTSSADDRIYELRTYYTNEGKLDNLHARFRDHTVALFEKHGMTNVAYWVPKENEEQVLIYLMSYPDREARDASWKAFLADPDWKNAYKASTADGKLVKKVDSVFLEMADFSPETKIEKQDPARLFELRQYTTNKGKLPNLHARFRDHTIALFAKHGIANLPYFQMAKDQPGKDNTLIYFVAHKDEEARKASFRAFSKDTVWIDAKNKSEENGKLLIKKGVESTLLVPTDYSPTK